MANNLTLLAEIRSAIANIQTKGISILLPALDEEQTSFDCAVKIGNTDFLASGDFDSYHPELSLAFRNFPSLKQIIELLEKETENAYFPKSLFDLANLRLSILGMTLNLAERSVSEIYFSLTMEKKVALIENVISFQPRLDMRIYAPFDSEFRAIEGELGGTWQLGKTAFETTLYYPDFSFSAGMAANQPPLDFGEVIKSVLSGIELPKPSIKLTGMELWGNFLSKSFSAEISAEDTWEFTLGGRKFEFGITHLQLTYENKGVSCGMNGSLDLAGLEVLLSAQYERSRLEAVRRDNDWRNCQFYEYCQ